MKRDFLFAFLLALTTALSRVIFAEHDFGGISYDSGSYALAVQSYDLTQTRPHLPGYYLHIQAIKLIRLVTHDTHKAMLFLSILYSSLAMGLLYLLLRRWFNMRISLLLTGITLSNPMVWFYGCVTEIYAFDLFFGVALVGLSCVRGGIYATPFFLGFFSGVRPSSGVLLLPLYAFLWYRHLKSKAISIKSALFSQLPGIVGFLLWFLPMIHSAGGLKAYLSLYSTHYPVEKISLLQNWYRFSSFFVFLLPPYLIIVVDFVFNVLRHKGTSVSKPRTGVPIPKSFVQIMLWWFIPPFLFFLFFHYSRGFFLLCAPAFFSLAILFFHKKPLQSEIFMTAIVAQILMFVFMPYSLPKLQTLISPQSRQMNIARVWWYRTASVYLMAQSYIRALEEKASDIEMALKSTKSLIKESEPQNTFIFLDPTFPLSIRSMQVKYPHLHFARFSFHKKDQYEIYSGLIEKSQTGLKDMICRAVIVSRSDFVRRYLEEIQIEVHHSNYFTAFTVPEEACETLANTYDVLFSRVK